MAARKWFWSITTLGVAAGLMLATGVTGCGSSSNKGTPAHVEVTAPVDGSAVRAGRITVRGTVSPSNAAVRVLGQSAQVDNNVFSSSVSLHPGANNIDVVATAPGVSPSTTAITVIRSRTATRQPPPPGGSPARSGAPPPATAGRTNCGGGIAAGPNTTCAFARNVVSAYRQTGGGTVQVYSPVTRQTYSMSCTSSPPHVCTGANNASVYFP